MLYARALEQRGDGVLERRREGAVAVGVVGGGGGGAQPQARKRHGGGHGGFVFPFVSGVIGSAGRRRALGQLNCQRVYG